MVIRDKRVRDNESQLYIYRQLYFSLQDLLFCPEFSVPTGRKAGPVSKKKKKKKRIVIHIIEKEMKKYVHRFWYLHNIINQQVSYTSTHYMLNKTKKNKKNAYLAVYIVSV